MSKHLAYNGLNHNRETQMIAPTQISLLELLHPRGMAESCLVIGSNCPEILLPQYTTVAGNSIDLVIIAPTPAECHSRGWLQGAAEVTAKRLSRDGLVYVLAPPYWRFKIAYWLRRQGLSLVLPVVHVPSWSLSQWLVPLSPVPAQHALATLIPTSPWRLYLAQIAFWLPGNSQFLHNLLPATGLVFQKPGAPHLFTWLFQLLGKECQTSHVVIRPSWRGRNGACILYCFVGGDMRPFALAKLALAAASVVNLLDEASILHRLGPVARSAGAQVPQPMLTERLGGRLLLIETALYGQLMSTLLTSQPERFVYFLERAVSWLEHWNCSTGVLVLLNDEVLNRELVLPAGILAPHLDQGTLYQTWLAQLCLAVTGVPVSLVAAHNDLTMSNLLWDEKSGLAVVDWETGSEACLPLLDFFYMVTDAVMTAAGYTDRLEAFRACFTPEGKFASTIKRLQGKLNCALEISPKVAELCFHACWLHHAVNEHHSSPASGSRPFLTIVQWLALNRLQLEGVIGG